jgi:hypothetical protein
MSFKKTLMERGMKLMSDPRVMKLMSNPKVMKVVMEAFQLRGKAQASIDAKVKAVAGALHLATHDEVRELKSTIRSLEAELKKVQSRIDAPNGEKSVPAASKGAARTAG